MNCWFQANIKPQTDGCNGLRYNLTPDIMESIFRTYPAGMWSLLWFVSYYGCNLTPNIMDAIFRTYPAAM